MAASGAAAQGWSRRFLITMWKAAYKTYTKLHNLVAARGEVDVALGPL